MKNGYKARRDRYRSQKQKRDQAEAWHSLYQKLKEDRDRKERSYGSR